MNYEAALRSIRTQRPLVHCVSNIVSANDCANLLLTVGASPMMALAEEEMAEIAAISAACVLNTGTPDAQRFRACALRGEWANRLRQPIVLDPVGVGASTWRMENVRALLERFRPNIVRVNLSEARALIGLRGDELGVDSQSGTADEAARHACALARQLKTTVLLSGAIDVASDGDRSLRIAGGSPMTSAVTGSGCMLSALCGAFAAVEADSFHAAAMASAFWKDCAEQAHRRAAALGSLSFRSAMIDAASRTSTEC